MGAIDRWLRTADRFQQRHPALAFPVAVWVKFRYDRAGNLAALISYYAFLAIFPLLLIMITVLNILLRNSPRLQDDLFNSALSQYPVIGTQIRDDLGSISETGLPLLFGVLVLLFGVRKVAGAMQNALCEVWGIQREERPGFPVSLLWAMALVFVVGIGFVVTTFLSGLIGGTGDLISGAGAYLGAAVISLVLNFGIFWLGFRIATLFMVAWRRLRTGAAIAAISWQGLQVVGGYVVSHQLHRASDLYGTFGIVLGLLAWLFLQAEVTLYAAEADVMLATHGWPRSFITQLDPLPDARPCRVVPVKGPAQRRHAKPAGHAYGVGAVRRIFRARRAVVGERRQRQRDDRFGARRDRGRGLRRPDGGDQAAQDRRPGHRDRQEPVQHLPAAAVPGGDRRPEPR
jgi:YihY family inner membrane protein